MARRTRCSRRPGSGWRPRTNPATPPPDPGAAAGTSGTGDAGAGAFVEGTSPGGGPGGDPVVGWRYWQLDPATLRLRSVTQRRFEWHPGKPLRAGCLIDRHAAPDEGCSCGIYASPDLDTLRHHGLCLAPELLVVGQVGLWGRLVVDAHGYRAAYGYPRALWAVTDTLGDRTLDDFLAPLRAYEVPVSTMPLADAAGEVSLAQLTFQAMSRPSPVRDDGEAS